MDIEALRREKQRLNNRLDWADGVLRAYMDGRCDEMGIILDEVNTPLYKAIKQEYEKAFQAVREFNGKYAKILNKN